MPTKRLRLSGESTLDKYDVKLMGRALRDLDGIYTYIAGTFQEPDTALKLVETIEREIFSLDHMPCRCPERRRGVYANRGYRQLLVKNYTVIYRVDEPNKQVIVVTVRYSPSNF